MSVVRADYIHSKIGGSASGLAPPRTIVASFTGPYPVTSSIVLTHVGNVVYAKISAVTGTSTAAAVFTATGAIPVDLRPASSVYLEGIVVVGAAHAKGCVTIASNGTMTVGRDSTSLDAAFPNSGVAGWSDMAVMWCV
jgi:hypothetical protein